MNRKPSKTLHNTAVALWASVLIIPWLTGCTCDCDGTCECCSYQYGGPPQCDTDCPGDDSSEERCAESCNSIAICHYVK